MTDYTDLRDNLPVISITRSSGLAAAVCGMPSARLHHAEEIVRRDHHQHRQGLDHGDHPAGG
ncbi:MAG: hypothetical protein K8D98_00015, partial [Rhodanobacter sp.]|nr:hypothetical protein [Rhodanobacter sp.]